MGVQVFDLRVRVDPQRKRPRRPVPAGPGPRTNTWLGGVDPYAGHYCPRRSSRTSRGVELMPLPRRHDVDLEYLRSKDWWSKVDVQGPDDCWNWKLSTASHGYGQTWDKITVRLAHRVAWALHHDRQVPGELTVDHICRNRLCCNPAHLRLLPNRVNATLNGQTEKTHCVHGHEFTPENTALHRLPNGRFGRKCRACMRGRHRKAA